MESLSDRRSCVIFLVMSLGSLASVTFADDCETIPSSIENCFGCQFLRADYNVPKPGSRTSVTGPVQRRTGGTGTAYNCTTNGDMVVTAVSTITLRESVTFSHVGLELNAGLNAIVTAGAKLNLPQGATTNQAIHVQVSLSGSQVLPRCEGLGVRGHYDVISKYATEVMYRNVSYYTWCDCYLNMGGGAVAVFENLDATYFCNPEVVRAESSLLGMGDANNPETLVMKAFFTPPRAPSGGSPPECDDCDEIGEGGGGEEEDEENDGGDDGDDPLIDDPDGDADGDGIPNSQDDTPFGYDGDDPDGDDDGDGIPNRIDPTPYGDHGPPYNDHGPAFVTIPIETNLFVLPRFWLS